MMRFSSSCVPPNSIILVLLALLGLQQQHGVASFQSKLPPMTTKATTIRCCRQQQQKQQSERRIPTLVHSLKPRASTSALFYRNHTVTDTDHDSEAAVTVVNPYTIMEPSLPSSVGQQQTRSKQSAIMQSHTMQQQQQQHSSSFEEEEAHDDYKPSWLFRREVDRMNIHPIFKVLPSALESLGLPLFVSSLLCAATMVTMLVATTTTTTTSLSLSWSALTLPLPQSLVLMMVLPLSLLLVTGRKVRWEQLCAASRSQHQAAFDVTTASYRKQQRELVDRLLAEQEKQLQASHHRDWENTKLPSVVGVTMATGQEGQGVVRSLVEAPQFQHATILALVRNPQSRAAQALRALCPRGRVQLVRCDSTDAASLQQALQGAQAVYLATTLNQGNAGKWSMQWDAGAYQIQQGRAFCQAAAQLPALRHVVYGTAPLRKWPDSFVVEAPIHYAAKWRVEELLMQAALPVTFLRKCPYHENFTKLTQTTSKNQATKTAAMGVEGGGAFDGVDRKLELASGVYQIKAFTPPEFAYNMMDPRDAGKWAVVAFSHANILVGQSLSAASDVLTGPEMAEAATDCGALGDGVVFEYSQQPRWLFESLAFVEPTFVYISGLQRWHCDGGVYDLDARGVEHARKLVDGNTWTDHLQREGLGQFTETMADLLPDITKRF